MKYIYGDFTQSQIAETKKKMRKQIFFLLLIVDPKTAEEYKVDVVDVFQNALWTFGGLNDLLGYPKELVTIMSWLDEAFLEYQKGDEFQFGKYRKLILDAGNEVLKIKEVDDA